MYFLLTLKLIDPIAGWVSPRLGIRFELSESQLHIYRPGSHPFLTDLALEQQLQ
jgi:hypothetical protein